MNFGQQSSSERFSLSVQVINDSETSQARERERKANSKTSTFRPRCCWCFRAKEICKQILQSLRLRASSPDQCTKALSTGLHLTRMVNQTAWRQKELNFRAYATPPSSLFPLPSMSRRESAKKRERKKHQRRRVNKKVHSIRQWEKSMPKSRINKAEHKNNNKRRRRQWKSHSNHALIAIRSWCRVCSALGVCCLKNSFSVWFCRNRELTDVEFVTLGINCFGDKPCVNIVECQLVVLTLMEVYSGW